MDFQLKGSMVRNQFKLLLQIPQTRNVMRFYTLKLYMNREDRYEHSCKYFLEKARVVPVQIFYIVRSIHFSRSGIRNSEFCNIS